jgi:hypothetical protein
MDESENKKRKIFCERCDDEITSRGDLITILQFPVIIAAYHLTCYSKQALGWNPRLTPLNGIAMIWLIIVFGVTCLIMFAVTHLILFLIVACIIPVLRLLSWVMVERILPKS